MDDDLEKTRRRAAGHSTVPTAKETLIETFQLWRQREQRPDREIDLRNEQIAFALANVLFEESYSFFEIFLDEAGLDSRRQQCFRECVFQTLVREKTLGDLPALARVIAEALPSFFSNPELIQLVRALEGAYQKQVIEQYPPGIPPQIPPVDCEEKLYQLVLGMLEVIDL